MPPRRTDPLKVGWHNIMTGDGGGYGFIGYQLYENVRKAGAHMIGNTEFGWEALVAVSPPRSALIGLSESRPDLCFHAMFECTTIPKEWPGIFNKAGLIWVPSEYCRELFIEHGVKTPIFKVGYAVESELYVPVKRVERDEPFKVIIWADSIMSRKNVLMSIRAFLMANLPDAVCEVKVSDGIAPNGRWMMDGRPINNVTVFSDQWHRNELVKWIQDADVGMYLSGGEGFGLMPLEMMATGLPVICAANTGMMEYLDPSYSMMVDCPTTEPSPSMSTIYGMPLETWKPNFEQTVEYLRWAYYNRKELYELGNRAVEPVTSETWETVGLKAYAHLFDHFANG